MIHRKVLTASMIFMSWIMLLPSTGISGIVINETDNLIYYTCSNQNVSSVALKKGYTTEGDSYDNYPCRGTDGTLLTGKTLTFPAPSGNICEYYLLLSYICPPSCSGYGNEGIPIEYIWYRDWDGDGYTNGQTTTSCSQPAYYYKRASDLISKELDCDDNTSEITYPCSDKNKCRRKGPANSSNDTATGELTHDQALFSVKGGALPLNVTLSYMSQYNRNSSLRRGWKHNYDIYITEMTVNNEAVVIFRNGPEKRKYNRFGGVYSPLPGDYSTLVRNWDGTYRITERNGTKYDFNSSGIITSVADKYFNIMTFTYDGSGLKTVNDSSGRTVTFNYDTSVNPHRLRSIADPEGNLYSFEYDANGMLWKVVNPAPVPDAPQGYWEYTYYAGGYLQTKRDPSGNISQYFYNGNHKLIKTIDPEGGTDPTGHTREYTYSTELTTDMSTTFKEKDSGNWIYTYNSTTGNVKSKTDSNGKVTSYTYHSNGNTKSETRPGDGITRYTTFYTYDSYGNTITVSDPIDLSTITPTVDPETVTDPLTIPGIKVAAIYAYDHAYNDRILSMSDERGTTVLTTTYLYTTEGGYEATIITDPEGKTTKTRYNANGTIKDTTDANGKITSYEYYADTLENRAKGLVGLLYTVTDISGIKTTFTDYDKNGNLTAMKVTNSAAQDITSSTFSYDALGRLTGESSTALNNPALPVITAGYGYDMNGNRTSVIDAENHETKYEFNYRGQVKKVTDAYLKDTIYQYGGTGGTGCSSCGGGVDKLTGITDANQHTTSYQYDTLGRLEKEIDPLGKTIRYTYYDSGLVKQKIDATTGAENVLITYEYNSRGQLTKKRYADNTEETYTYDDNGRLETATNPNISYTYTWYNNGWAKSVTDSDGKAITYDEYDGVGNRKKVTILAGTADQRVITYDYDTANRPSHIYSGTNTFTYNYDTSGRRHTLGYPNQITATWDYDGLDRLTSLTHKDASNNSISTIGYTEYDKTGNRKAITANGSPTTYTYDNVYRLKTATKTKESEAYTYDDVGNRLTGPGFKDTDYAYNSANQMTTGRKINYAYDNNGNQAERTLPNGTDKTWTQSWDYENRLIKLEKIKGSERKTVTFKYDPFGRRIEKEIETVKGGVIKTQTYTYVYDNEDIVQETLVKVDSTTETTYYTHGPGIDEPLAMERNGAYYYYHADGLGSITAVTNASKAVVQSYTYDSFGVPKPTTNFRNSYTYTGREWDSETGYYFYRARYYDPMAGRWISKDPIGFRGGINLYAAMKNNPILYTDPLGLAAGVNICVRPLAAFPNWLPWWASPANHAYIQIGSWSSGFQSDNTVHIPEDNPNHAGKKCWPAIKRDSGTLPDGTKCECATDAQIQKCIKNYAQQGSKAGGYPSYGFISNNCGDWVISALNRCCLKGKVPNHAY